LFPVVEMSENLKKDLLYVKNSASELETFLLSNDVIRTLPDISLSAGGVMLAQKRLQAANLEGEAAESWQQVEQIRGHWQVAWANKCQQEARMRMRLWGDFILGLAHDGNEPSSAYRHQVRNRVIVQLIEDMHPEKVEEYAESIQRKDKLLVKYTADNVFIWEDEVKDGFPKEKFWYLYRVMRYEKMEK
jgi:hypothetical protein